MAKKEINHLVIPRRKWLKKSLVKDNPRDLKL